MAAQQASTSVKRKSKPSLFRGIKNLSQKSKSKIKSRVLKREKDLDETKMKLSNMEKLLNEKNTEIKGLKKDVAEKNLQWLQSNGLTTWGVLKLFEKQSRQSEYSGTNKVEQFKKYVNQASRSAELKAWDFTVETFAFAAADFYNKLCKPKRSSSFTLLTPFDPLEEDFPSGIVCIEEDLQDSEWRVLGVLLKLLPLPSGTLVKCNNTGSRVVIDDLQSLRSN